MIRFIDRKMIYRIANDNTQEEINRELREIDCRDDKDQVIIFRNNQNKLIGWTKYDLATDKKLVTDFLVADEMLWENAKTIFDEEPDKEVLVIDKQGNPLSFCYSDNNTENIKYNKLYHARIKALEILGKDLLVSLGAVYANKNVICIIGFNEFAWRIYHILLNFDMPVYVEGKEWEWFGIKSSCKEKNYTESEKLFIYAEGSEQIKEKNKSLAQEFAFLYQWGKQNRARYYEAEIKRITEINGLALKVLIPQKNQLDLNNWTKNDLLNLKSPLEYPPVLSNDEEKRARQKAFFDSWVYDKIEKGQNYRTHGWKAVLYNGIKARKCDTKFHKNRIYLVGPCIVESLLSATEKSLVAQLQKHVEKHDYEVIQCPIPVGRFDLIRNEIKKLPLRKKDMVIFIDTEDNFLAGENVTKELNLIDLFNRPRKEDWIYDGHMLHLSDAANFAIAQEIYTQYLEAKCKELEEIKENTWLQKGEVLDVDVQKNIQKYTDGIRVWKNKKDETIGAIVMNCNPFTRGHLYLIETAAASVEYLYIFVVEEDKSFFPFEIRLKLVQEGTSHLKNVAVVPSGKYVLSYDTLPLYFEKAERQEAYIDASEDVEIFARYIAPKLGITRRFVGEEPTDLITKQYNEQMSVLLPEFGIEFVEIPRIVEEEDGQVISASKVRSFLELRDWRMINRYVPKTTYVFLQTLITYLGTSKVVIYGAGFYGRKLYEFFKSMKFNIVGWVDKRYTQLETELQIESPSELQNKQFDYIVVAVKKEDVYLEICEEIRAMLGNVNIIGSNLKFEMSEDEK